MKNNVLVADDDPVIRMLAGEYLRAAGMTVTAVDTGSGCVSALGTAVPDLLLLDCFFPDMTGFEVLRTLRADPRTAAVSVVMLSASGESESLARAQGVSADRYLDKPFAPPALIALASELLRR